LELFEDVEVKGTIILVHHLRALIQASFPTFSHRKKKILRNTVSPSSP